eukprot:maker-scaffold_3-snap-gene-0.47-mRNA-1 protein AED:0.08 eAED:0.08 QI:96/1/1/1/0.75/0.6/5/64/544
MKLISLALGQAFLLSKTNALSDFVKENVREHLTQDNNRVVRIKPEHFPSIVQDRLTVDGHELDFFGANEDGHLDIRLDSEAIRRLELEGVQYEDTTEHWAQHFEENYADPNFFCTDSTEDCVQRDLQSFYESYQTLDAIHSRMDSLAASNPSLVEIDSIGESYEGRDLKLVWIGENAKSGNKDLVYYQCNIHAREWLSPMFCSWLSEKLIDGSTESNRLLDRFSFAIVPSLNPDGYVYTYTTYSLWRKSRKPNSGSSCIGTDLNRNWGPSQYHCGQGASSNPCSDTYCGTNEFDNVETAAVESWATSYASRLISMADVHSYGGYYMSPWGWTTSLPPAADYDRMEQCFNAARTAIRNVNGLNFIVGSSANAIYVAAGGTEDWFYGDLDVIYSYCIELRGNSFQPSASNIMPSNNEIFAGILAQLDCAYDIETGGGSSPVAEPTSPPVAGGCVDSVPSGITVGGVPTPCEELVIYCSGYDFVRENCPLSCGECYNYQAMRIAPGEEMELQNIEVEKSNTVVYLGIGIGAALFTVAGVLAAIKRNN